MPRPIRHGLPAAQPSSSGAVDSLQPGLPSKTKLDNNMHYLSVSDINLHSLIKMMSLVLISLLTQLALA